MWIAVTICVGLALLIFAAAISDRRARRNGRRPRGYGFLRRGTRENRRDARVGESGIVGSRDLSWTDAHRRSVTREPGREDTPDRSR